MKLTQTQINLTMKRLRDTASELISTVEQAAKERMIPPMYTEKELERELVKLAYDQPKRIARLYAYGDPIPMVEKRHEERKEAYAQLDKLMTSLRKDMKNTLVNIEAELVFNTDETRPDGDPYEDLVGELLEVVQQYKESLNVD